MPDEIKNAVSVVENVLFTLPAEKHSLNNCSLVFEKQHPICHEQAVQVLRVKICNKKLNFCKVWGTFHLSGTSITEDSSGRLICLWASMECCHS